MTGYRLVLILPIGVLVGAAWIIATECWFAPNKKIYATLQRLELQSRDRTPRLPATITARDGVHVIAIASGDPASPVVWIAGHDANPAEPDGIFRVGEVVAKQTTCQSIDPILQDQDLAPAVVRYLLKNCVRKATTV